MPDEQLMRVIGYHRERAVGGLGDLGIWHPKDAKDIADELLDALSACDAVLADDDARRAA